MVACIGFLRLGASIAGATLTEPGAPSGYAAQPFAGDITDSVLTLSKGITFGPASQSWSVAVAAVSALASGSIAYASGFGALTVAPGAFATIPPGSYALERAI